MSDGTRKITSVSEITGMEGDVITMQDIFVFERSGIGPGGKVTGRFRATGIRPKCSDRLAIAGMPLHPGEAGSNQGVLLRLGLARHIESTPRLFSSRRVPP